MRQGGMAGGAAAGRVSTAAGDGRPLSGLSQAAVRLLVHCPAASLRLPSPCLNCFLNADMSILAARTGQTRKDAAPNEEGCSGHLAAAERGAAHEACSRFDGHKQPIVRLEIMAPDLEQQRAHEEREAGEPGEVLLQTSESSSAASAMGPL